MPEDQQAQETVPPRALRWLCSFGAFWWDFLVSDTPELLLGVLVIVGVVVLLVKGASLNTLAIVLFPALVVVLLAVSVALARPRRPR